MAVHLVHVSFMWGSWLERYKVLNLWHSLGNILYNGQAYTDTLYTSDVAVHVNWPRALQKALVKPQQSGCCPDSLVGITNSWNWLFFNKPSRYGEEINRRDKSSYQAVCGRRPPSVMKLAIYAENIRVEKLHNFMISSFRLVLNGACNILSCSPACGV
jgi:hypothetical protein